MAKILVIDDDTDICLLLSKYLKKHDHEVDTAYSLRSGMQKFKKASPQVVLCDYRLPDGEGLDAIERFKAFDAQAQVIIMTGYSDVKVAIDCIKRGAFDYVTKPIHPEEILHTIASARKKAEMPAGTSPQSDAPSKPKGDGRKTKPSKTAGEQIEYVQGDSPQSKQVSKLIDLVAPTNMSVIVGGETGTGKEYVAKRIHAKSERSDKPFVAIDCGALPKEIAASELFGHKKGSFTGALQDKKGAFEMANGGTLFLDEIANLSYDNQVKLLRVLQERKIRRIGEERERKVDVRIIGASNEDLWKKAREGEFREDLFHRLNEFSIQLSPLRERSREIEQFAKYFLGKSNQALGKDVDGFDKKATAILCDHAWPGNLRELRNVVKRAVLMAESKQIKAKDLPIDLRESVVEDNGNGGVQLNHQFSSLKEASEAAERAMILRTLERTAYNKSKTAELLQVDRKTLYNKISAYNIDLKH